MSTESAFAVIEKWYADGYADAALARYLRDMEGAPLYTEELYHRDRDSSLMPVQVGQSEADIGEFIRLADFDTIDQLLELPNGGTRATYISGMGLAPTYHSESAAEAIKDEEPDISEHEPDDWKACMDFQEELFDMRENSDGVVTAEALLAQVGHERPLDYIADILKEAA